MNVEQGLGRKGKEMVGTVLNFFKRPTQYNTFLIQRVSVTKANGWWRTEWEAAAENRKRASLAREAQAR